MGDGRPAVAEGIESAVEKVHTGKIRGSKCVETIEQVEVGMADDFGGMRRDDAAPMTYRTVLVPTR